MSDEVFVATPVALVIRPGLLALALISIRRSLDR
jgi:hypothetical protein